MTFAKRKKSHTKRYILDFMKEKREATTREIYEYLHIKCRTKSGKVWCPTYPELAGRLRGVKGIKNLNPKIKGVYINNNKALWVYVEEIGGEQ